jgi:hypothetical protein
MRVLQEAGHHLQFVVAADEREGRGPGHGEPSGLDLPG